MKTILLARIWSKEQKEGQVILAQVRRLREYAEKHRLSLIHEFQLTESSTRKTRNEFNKIVENNYQIKRLRCACCRHR